MSTTQCFEEKWFALSNSRGYLQRTFSCNTETFIFHALPHNWLRELQNMVNAHMHTHAHTHIHKYTHARTHLSTNVIRAKIIATSSVETPQHHKTKRCALHCSCVLRGISDVPHIHLYISDHSLCCAQF